MNKEDLLFAIKSKLDEYRSMPYSDLVKKQKSSQPDTYENGAYGSDDFYQIEVDVVFDDHASENLRIIGLIDDGRNLKGTYSLIISHDGSILSEGGNIWFVRGFFFNSAISLFLLRELPFDRFAFPRWQAWLAMAFIGALTGLDPTMRAGTPEMPGLPLWAAVLAGMLLILIVFPLIVAFMKWWMKRGQRWDGQGDLFNLIAASWLVADALAAGLVALGVPMLLTLPLWLYSVWVTGNALSGAIPRASLGYSIGGIVLSLVPMLLLAGIVMGLLGFLAMSQGLAAPGGLG